MTMTWRRSAYGGYALVLLAIVCWFVVDFPILRVELAIGFLAYAACLWRWPWLWLVLLPCLLPLFDMAPWSGRFFFDEFDALVLLTAGVLTLRTKDDEPVATLSRELLWVLLLLTAAYSLSSLIRLWPPSPITANSFANYTSPYNCLRVAKGFVWALLLLLPLRQVTARYRDARLLLGLGFLGGLTGVALISLYERWLFPGVFSWITDYRTTASFSSMHTGDGPIDIWLAMTIPFIGLLLIDRRWILLLPLTTLLSLLSAYALVVTESRGPVIAIAIAYAIGLTALLATHTSRRRAGGVLTVSLSAAILLAIVGMPIVAQSSLAQRFSQTHGDALARLGHWRNALALRDPSIFTQAFGMGLGSYPAIHVERSTREPRATRYQFVENGGDHHLTLWSGQNLYMGQPATAVQNSVYGFTAKVRTSETHPSLNVGWCELWMLYSANCAWDTFPLRAKAGQWQELRGTIQTKEVGSGRRIAGFNVRRPTRLTYFVADAPATGVDIGDVSLKDKQGRELLRNGDFSKGSDFWFWAVDTDLQWHTLNMAVNILFEQGWLGIVAVASLLWITLLQLGRQISEGDPAAAVFLAAIAGFVVNGITISTFDQPRLVFAFFMICFTSVLTGAAVSDAANVAPDL